MKFLSAKNEALEKLQEYIAEHGIPKVLRSEKDKDLIRKHFKGHCNENKTKQEFTVPKTPEQNGMAERANLTIVEIARCLLLQAKLPKTYWLRAIATACYLRKCVSTKKRIKNPFRKITEESLN